ncbi:serine/threonine protein phosphatase 1 [Mesonia phycicola]|uniref:Serine/threonine protein phosphatase 1 n=1 Tax=Mesonia phycicola TaxID=579105 RepID=A0A1M6CUU6_9FLAO|nr:metallophosphoesterase family protein [Mesonia phycicola]SHI64792.1 serine/threonine protein phosphatase 1 [Mesonia phycicola]
MRKFAIGDIHGGLKALKQILERAQITPQDQLIFLGDYVDGWSDSANVVSFLLELKQTHNCIFIRGNHDDLVHKWLKTGDLNENWLKHGGQSSKDAYEKLAPSALEKHKNFYHDLENYYIDKENNLFLHAGFANMHGPQNEYEPYMVYWDRTLWETALALDKNLKPEDLFYPKRFKLFKEIFIGHTPVTRINQTKPVNAANIWNVDTGAAFKGPLSIINIETKEVIQSDPVYQLYPNESGRN